MSTDLRLDEVAPQRLDLIRPCLDSAYADLPHDALVAVLETELTELTPDEFDQLLTALELNWGKILGSAMGGAGTGAAVGTSVVPGWGTAIGAGLGALASGLGAALGGRKGGPPRRPVRQRPRPVRGGGGPRGPGARPVGRRRRGRPLRPRRAATNALLAALQDPKVVQALTSLVLGAAGRKDVPLPASGTATSQSAVLNLIKELADLALLEAGSDDSVDSTAYLLGDSGDFAVDPDDTTERAFHLLDVLDVERDALVESIRSAPTLAEDAEDLITPLTPTPAKRVRFQAGVRSTTHFPHSAICQLIITMSRGGGRTFYGTGFYIGENRILTAAHNILDGDFGRATRMIVTPGRNGITGRPFKGFEVLSPAMVTYPGWAASMKNPNLDIGVLKVRRGPPNGKFFPLESVFVPPRQRVAVCGYAADRTKGVDPHQQNIDHDIIRKLDVTRGTLTYSLNTTGGTSGSPVYLPDGSVRAIGVHTNANGPHTNLGSWLSPWKIAWINAVTDEGMPQDLEPFDAGDAVHLTPLPPYDAESGDDPWADAAETAVDPADDWPADELVESDGWLDGLYYEEEEAALDELVDMGAFQAGDFHGEIPDDERWADDD